MRPGMTPRRWFWALCGLLLLYFIVSTRWRGDSALPVRAEQDVAAKATSTLLAPVSGPLTWTQAKAVSLTTPTPAVDASLATAIAQENRQLRNEKFLLLGEIDQLRAQLREYKSTANLPGVSTQQYYVANLSGYSPSIASETCTIDAGSTHGIRPGMLVLSEAAPLGRVISTGPMVSTVRLITDPDRTMRINAQLVRPQPGGEGLRQAQVIVENAQVRGVGNGMLACDLPIGTFAAKKGDLLLVHDNDWRPAVGGVIGEVVEVGAQDLSTRRYTVMVQPRVQPQGRTQVSVLLQ